MFPYTTTWQYDAFTQAPTQPPIDPADGFPYPDYPDFARVEQIQQQKYPSFFWSNRPVLDPAESRAGFYDSQPIFLGPTFYSSSSFGEIEELILTPDVEYPDMVIDRFHPYRVVAINNSFELLEERVTGEAFYPDKVYGHAPREYMWPYFFGRAEPEAPFDPADGMPYPEYPDFARAKQISTQKYPFFFWSNRPVLDPADGYGRAVYPDQVWDYDHLEYTWPAWFYGTFETPFNPAEGFGTAEYPDFARALRVGPQHYPYFFWGHRPVLDPADGYGRAFYPDRVWDFEHLEYQWPALFWSGFTPAEPFDPADGFPYPEYPDFALVELITTQKFPYFFWGHRPVDDPADIQWETVYPDFTRRVDIHPALMPFLFWGVFTPAEAPGVPPHRSALWRDLIDRRR